MRKLSIFNGPEDNLRRAFDEVLCKENIYKIDVLVLKRLAKVLVDVNSEYKPLLSKITTQINGMDRFILSEKRRKKLENLRSFYL